MAILTPPENKKFDFDVSEKDSSFTLCVYEKASDILVMKYENLTHEHMEIFRNSFYYVYQSPLKCPHCGKCVMKGVLVSFNEIKIVDGQTRIVEHSEVFCNKEHFDEYSKDMILEPLDDNFGSINGEPEFFILYEYSYMDMFLYNIGLKNR